MQKRFRDNIKQHFPELVDKINPETLASYLLKKKVLKKKEVNKILAVSYNIQICNGDFIYI